MLIHEGIEEGWVVDPFRHHKHSICGLDQRRHGVHKLHVVANELERERKRERKRERERVRV